ncbi:MAG: hypothetical protein ABR95_04690 [Sphingobacteriales bacterium BACL12 MAG-120813-bin55]|jgi:hypothetical protein|nr:MAG: hypothetical protein ABR95_04690 [Sphingobacteriales bacterium BACL12 MAG-120813-bin55]
MEGQQRKTGLFLVLLAAAALNVNGQELENLMAFNGSNPTLEVSSAAAAPAKSSAVEVTGYTDAGSMIISSYFTLAGKSIKPYMKVESNNITFDAQVVQPEENISIRFNNDHIEFTENGKINRLEIIDIAQYLNNSQNCLVQSKIEVNCKPTKVKGEKVKEVAVFIDHNNHISFISIGNTEYYLQP